MSAVQVARAERAGTVSSDDRIVAAPDAVVVLDGASSFGARTPPAGAYVDALGEQVRHHLIASPDDDLKQLLARSISSVSIELNLVPGQSPSSAIAIVRARDHAVDVLVLGDCLVVHPGGFVSDERMAEVAAPQRRRYRERLAAGGGYDAIHRDLLAELQREQSLFRNRDNGFWICEADPTAAAHAICASMPRTQTPWLIVSTDGAYRPMQHLGLDDWASLADATDPDLNAILAQCHSWEVDVDPDGQDLPRAKRHDDKSLVAARLSP